MEESERRGAKPVHLLQLMFLVSSVVRRVAEKRQQPKDEKTEGGQDDNCGHPQSAD